MILFNRLSLSILHYCRGIHQIVFAGGVLPEQKDCLISSKLLFAIIENSTKERLYMQSKSWYQTKPYFKCFAVFEVSGDIPTCSPGFNFKL